LLGTKGYVVVVLKYSSATPFIYSFREGTNTAATPAYIL
jgi:hypothetical protein